MFLFVRSIFLKTFNIRNFITLGFLVLSALNSAATWGSDSSSSNLVRFSIHDQHAPLLRSGSAQHEKGALTKILTKISQNTNIAFEPVWRFGQASGEDELNSGKVNFIIDPTEELLKRSSAEQINATLLRGHLAVIRLSTSKKSSGERFGYLDGVSKKTLITDYLPITKIIAMQSFSEIHHGLIHQKIDAAVMPLRLAQYYLLHHGLEESIVIERFLTKEPFTYKWLFNVDSLHIKNQMEQTINSWSSQEVAELMGITLIPDQLQAKQPSLLDEWLYMSALFFIFTIFAMLSWVWHLRKININTVRRELELRQSNTEAIQANNAKSKFLATVSHEIRTPMHAVLGVQEMLLQSASLKKNEKSLLQSAQHSANSLLEMLNQVLDLSKIEAGKSPLNKQPIHLPELIKHCVNPFLQLAENAGIECDIQLDQHIAESLLIDTGLIRQIMQNLLSNAIKFTPNGSIRISCQVLNDTYAEQLIQITIADTGIGMPAEEISRILMPYEQITESKSSLTSGTGLGLAITCQLLKSLASNLIIESCPDIGTTASFSLNLSRSSARPNPIIDTVKIPEKIAPSGLNHLKALVVDDHPATLEVLKYQLSQLGLSTYTANDPLIALEILSKQEIDLLITDESMPHMNGRELAKAVKTKLPKLKVIGLTADIFAKEKSDVYKEAGMDCLLIKPVKLNELQQAIQNSYPQPPFKSSYIKNPLFDFSKLNGFTGDDTKATLEILNSLLVVHNQALVQLNNPSFLTQIGELKSLAHQIRGGAELIGATFLIHCCLALERCSNNLVDKLLLNQLLDAIEKTNLEIKLFISNKNLT